MKVLKKIFSSEVLLGTMVTLYYCQIIVFAIISPFITKIKSYIQWFKQQWNVGQLPPH